MLHSVCGLVSGYLVVVPPSGGLIEYRRPCTWILVLLPGLETLSLTKRDIVRFSWARIIPCGGWFQLSWYSSRDYLPNPHHQALSLW